MNAEYNKKEMKAVHERDLDNLLDKLSLRDEFHAGNVKCKFCKDVIARDNIYSLIRESGSVNFICDKPRCISEFMLHMENKKQNLQNQ